MHQAVKNKKSLFFLLLVLIAYKNFDLKAKPKNHLYLESSSKKNFYKSDNRTIVNKKVNWESYKTKINEKDYLIWEKLDKSFDLKNYIKTNKIKERIYINDISLSSFNRSIVFSNKTAGPDIGWLVPPGLRWNKKYKFDASVRGHNRRLKEEPFLKWNGGDAVGQFYYQPIVREKYSFGLNMGMRSVYKGDAIGGQTNIGEGLSAGFRYDKKLSDSSGYAFGGEQLLHFDNLTDTGRNLYIAFSKAWWDKNNLAIYPITIGTLGIGTGKLAEGNVKGLCSDLLGGSGTEIKHQRSLCWAPIFSIARVHNKKLSTFFEYNSKWFLIGSSIVPLKELPLRASAGILISDHVDNYKVHNFNELRWVFRLNYGF